MKRFGVVLFLLFLLNSTVFAMEVPVSIQIPLLFKVFSFEKNIQTLTDSTIKIAIVYNVDDSQSIIVKDDVLNAFNANASKKIRGKDFSVAAVETDTDLSQFNVVYFTPGNDEKLANMIDVCNSNNVLTVTGETAYAQQGVTLALAQENSKPKIIINKNAAQMSGASFSATLLALARLI